MDRQSTNGDVAGKTRTWPGRHSDRETTTATHRALRYSDGTESQEVESLRAACVAALDDGVLTIEVTALGGLPEAAEDVLFTVSEALCARGGHLDIVHLNGLRAGTGAAPRAGGTGSRPIRPDDRHSHA